MKTLSQLYIEELFIPLSESNICEGFFDWLKGLFNRVTKEQAIIKDRLGKLPDIKINNLKTLQASKNIKSKIDNDIIKDLDNLSFNNIRKMFANKKEYFYDKDNKEIECETITYVYTPEKPFSNDEKYIVCLAIKAPKNIYILEDYQHIIDFEFCKDINIGLNIKNEIFNQYINNVIKKETPNIKGITIKYLNNKNDFPFKYNGKMFETNENGSNLLKLTFK